MAKAAPLSSNLLATKGSGSPVIAQQPDKPAVQPAEQETQPAVPLAPTLKKKTSSGVSKTLSYRCGSAKYKALRQSVLDFDLTGQEIIDQALDLWFAAHGIEVPADE